MFFCYYIITNVVSKYYVLKGGENMNFNSILKLYSMFYIVYMLITNKTIYNINVVSIIFYTMLIIKMFILIHNEIIK